MNSLTGKGVWTGSVFLPVVFWGGAKMVGATNPLTGKGVMSKEFAPFAGLRFGEVQDG